MAKMIKNGLVEQVVLSHRKALELAVARKWKTMLVLEDDFLCLSKEDFLGHHLRMKYSIITKNGI